MRKNVLFIALTAICAIPLMTSCGGSNDKPEDKEKTYKYSLIENGHTDYELIYPDSDTTTEASGANLLASYLYQSTGVNIPVVRESARNTNRKFISFGLTNAYKSANINMDQDKMNYDGYGIKTISGNIYVLGGKNNLSYNYSALYLLHDLINFNGYTDTEIDFDYLKKVGFDDYDLYDAPAFRNRDLYNGDLRIADDAGTYSLLLRNNPESYSKYGNAHTCFKVVGPSDTCVDVLSAQVLAKGDNVSFTFEENRVSGTISNIEISGENVVLTIGGNTYTVNKNFKIKRTTTSTYIKVHPDWFTGSATTSQWCWSNEDLFETVAMKVEEYMETLMTSSVNYLFISQNDLTDWCSCEECLASREHYGTDAAVVVKFINKLADRVKDKQKEMGIENQFLKVGTFAYEVTTTNPPVKLVNGNYVPIDDSVILRDNAFIRIAPINTDYSKSMYDSSNVAILEAFKGWSVLTDNVLVWGYNTNYNCFFYPFMGYEHLQELYKFYKDCNVTSIMEEGAYDSKQPGFIELKNYVSSKLLWNVDENVDYLIKDFMGAYYKDAAVYMQQFFDELRFRNEYIDANHLMSPSTGRIFAKFLPEKAYTFRQLKSWMELIEKALTSIQIYKDFNNDLYNKLRKRIEKEELIVLYSLIFGYISEYPDSDALALKKEFKRICYENDTLNVAEGKSLVNTFTEWGI